MGRSATKGWLKEFIDKIADKEVSKRLAQASKHLNEYHYDAWGFNPEEARLGATLFYWLYKHYWRAQIFGIERVPTGRVLLIANHSGQLPIDGTLIAVAMLMEANPPRMARGMVERWFTTLPVLGTLVTRHGSVVGDPRNCARLLENEECIMVFPEGVRGSGKLWKDRYKLMQFGLGFMRLALETDTPIVPIGVVGGEEQAPSFADIKPLARLFGMPYFPITPTWPWLGPFGLIPFPTKYRIYFGEPLRFHGKANDRDDVIQRKVDKVKREIRRLLARGLAERETIF